MSSLPNREGFGVDRVEAYLKELYIGFIGVPNNCIQMEVEDDSSKGWNKFCKDNGVTPMYAEGANKIVDNRYFKFRDLARYLCLDVVYLAEFEEALTSDVTNIHTHIDADVARNGSDEATARARVAEADTAEKEWISNGGKKW